MVKSIPRRKTAIRETKPALAGNLAKLSRTSQPIKVRLNRSIDRCGLGNVQWVTFEYHDPAATTVYLAGTFNSWRPDELLMNKSAHGKWFKGLLLPPGRHEYKFIIDGVWKEDPTAPSCNNPFGTKNSVKHLR